MNRANNNAARYKTLEDKLTKIAKVCADAAKVKTRLPDGDAAMLQEVLPEVHGFWTEHYAAAREGAFYHIVGLVDKILGHIITIVVATPEWNGGLD